MSNESLLPLTAQAPTTKQRLFVRYFTGLLVDLVVLNLFVEYSEHVSIDSFTTSLLAALVLQVLLKLTLLIEQHVSAFFKAKSGRLMTFLRFFFVWLVLFGSKFVILEAISFAFGDNVRFSGAFHGLAWLIAVIVTMLIAEEAVLRLYRRFDDR
jgi:membrane protease YdiL (CAAX protease family)